MENFRSGVMSCCPTIQASAVERFAFGIGTVKLSCHAPSPCSRATRIPRRNVHLQGLALRIDLFESAYRNCSDLFETAKKRVEIGVVPLVFQLLQLTA